MTKILSLDLGIHTGWACNTEEGLRYGTINLRKSKKDTRGQIYYELNNWLIRMVWKNVERSDVDMVAYEMPHNRGGATTEMLNTFAGTVQMVCYIWKIPHRSVHSLTIKKFMTGSGKATKEDMIKAVQKKHPGIKDLDEHQADAIALLCFMKAEQLRNDIEHCPLRND